MFCFTRNVAKCCNVVMLHFKKIFANILQIFYFKCNHLLSSTCVQHVFLSSTCVILVQHLQKCFANVLQHFCKCVSVTFLEVVTCKKNNKTTTILYNNEYQTADALTLKAFADSTTSAIGS